MTNVKPKIREVVMADGRKVRVELRQLADGDVAATLAGRPRAGRFVADSEAAVLALVLRHAVDCQPTTGTHYR